MYTLNKKKLFSIRNILVTINECTCHLLNCPPLIGFIKTFTNCLFIQYSSIISYYVNIESTVKAIEMRIY